MLKFVQKKLKEEKGLTLIELLAVIVILAIIAAIAIPAIGNIIQNSRENALVSDGQNTLAAANLYFTENASKEGAEVDVTTLVSSGYLDDQGAMSGTAKVKKITGGNELGGTAIKNKLTATFTKATNAKLSSDSRSDVVVFSETKSPDTPPGGEE